MKRIVGACLSQFDGDEDNYEMLIAYADGKEIGHVIYKDHALRMAKELAREFWLDEVNSDLLAASKILRECVLLSKGNFAVDDLKAQSALMAINTAISKAEGK